MVQAGVSRYPQSSPPSPIPAAGTSEASQAAPKVPRNSGGMSLKDPIEIEEFSAPLAESGMVSAFSSKVISPRRH